MSRAVYLAPRPEFQRELIIRKFYYTVLLQEYLVERDVNFISVNLRCLHQTLVGLRIDKGWEASCPGWFILPPAQNSRENG